MLAFLLLSLAAPGLAARCTNVIPYCYECSADGLTCQSCGGGFVLTTSNTCLYPCNTSSAVAAEPNPFYVEHASTCDATDPTKPTSCESGYSLSVDGERCVRCSPTEEVSEDNHCDSCVSDGEICMVCQDGWADQPSFCSRPATCKMGAGRIAGCLECSESNNLLCASCDADYKLAGGDCIPAALDGSSEYAIPNCKTAVWGSPRECALCHPGYGLSADKRTCMRCVTSELEPGDQHCQYCSMQSGGLRCESCEFGWTDTSSFCSYLPNCTAGTTKIPGCSTCDPDAPMRCTGCDENHKFDEATGTCIGLCTDPDSTKYIAHCLTCLAPSYSGGRMRCATCEPGYGPDEYDWACIPCVPEYSSTTEGYHCLACYWDYDYWYGYEEFYCDLCEEGWTGLYGFCRTEVNCKTATNSIKGCLTCMTGDDRMKCETCQTGYDRSDDAKQCIGKCVGANGVPNCASCDADDGTICATCASGYTVVDSGNRCQRCEDASVGPVSSQHCASCTSGTEGIVCLSCETNWLNETAFCSESMNCLLGESRIEHCASCDLADRMLCAACDPNYYLNKEQTVCEPACLSTNEANPYRVEHCIKCFTSWPDECLTCEGDMTTNSANTVCLSPGECYPASPGCEACDSYYKAECIKCSSEYQLDTILDICNIICDGTAIRGCIKCSTETPSKCGECRTDYVLTPDGECVSTVCAQVSANGILICGGKGTCALGSWGSWRCDCDAYPTDSTNQCACSSTATEGLAKDCVYTSDVDIYPYEKCYTTSCYSCRSNYFTPTFNCKNYWPLSCSYSGSYSIGCSSCNYGYKKDADDPLSKYYKCVPERKCSLSTMPHCAQCDETTCTLCMAGYSGVATGCETPCDAGPFCSMCDPNDPKVCLECLVGMPGYCMPYNSCSYTQVLGPDGNCFNSACSVPDTSYYGAVYGDNFAANISCAGHGICDEASGTCACDPGEHRNATTRCLGCENGYAMRNGECEPVTESCPASCSSCDSNGVCLTCAPGFSDLSSKCSKRCQESGCAICDESNPAICVKCREGYEYTASNAIQGLNTLKCMPYCEGDCPSGERCARQADGSAVCAMSGCVSNLNGIPTLCSNNGECVEGVCQCNPGAKYSYCGSCDDGYEADKYTGICAKLDEVCPACTYSTRCVVSGGVGVCMALSCVSGAGATAQVCNGMGTCMKNTCVCDDALRDSSTACQTCIPGYVLQSDGTCAPGSCLEGAGAIEHCEECDPNDPTRCIRCEPYFTPYITGKLCIVCLSDQVESEDRSTCVCTNPEYALNTVGKCASNACLTTVTNCRACYSASAAKCGICIDGYYLSEDRMSCNKCADGMVTSADGLSCTCPLGQELAGDDRTVCIVPKCHIGSSKVYGCRLCKASDPTQCHTCAETQVLSGNRCSCTGTQTFNIEGKCAEPLCVRGSSAVKHCMVCAADDPTKCGECATGYILSVSRTSCLCPQGTEPAADDTCQLPLCLTGATAVINCIRCSGSDPSKCGACSTGRVPSADGLSCQCEPGKVESSTGNCIVPACTIYGTEVPGCIRCRPDDPTLCEECVSPLTVNSIGTRCDGCPANEVPNSDGTCSCMSGMERINGKCEIPLCKLTYNIKYCTTCSPSDVTKCSACDSGRVPADGGVRCECPDPQIESPSGTCVVPQCLQASGVTDCLHCSPNDMTVCDRCKGGLQPSQDGKRCECATGTELATDGSTCVPPTCHQGASAVEHCTACTASDPAKCGACGDGYAVSSSGACACLPPNIVTTQGSCVYPSCIAASGGVQNCLECSISEPTKCTRCGGGMIVTQDGYGCGCEAGYILTDGGCEVNNCMHGRTPVPNCVRCGQAFTDCVECASGYELKDGQCVSVGGLSNGGAVGLAIGLVILVAVVVLVVVGLLVARRRRSGAVSLKNSASM